MKIPMCGAKNILRSVPGINYYKLRKEQMWAWWKDSSKLYMTIHLQNNNCTKRKGQLGKEDLETPSSSLVLAILLLKNSCGGITKMYDAYVI